MYFYCIVLLGVAMGKWSGDHVAAPYGIFLDFTDIILIKKRVSYFFPLEVQYTNYGIH